MAIVKRTQKEIDALLKEAQSIAQTGESPRPTLTYEQGVEQTLQWLLGWSDDGPLDL